MATAEHLKKLMELCEKYELEGVRTVEKYTLEELARIYNGAGPDSWIPAARHSRWQTHSWITCRDS